MRGCFRAAAAVSGIQSLSLRENHGMIQTGLRDECADLSELLRVAASLFQIFIIVVDIVVIPLL